jgi:hypothetical protein
MRSTIIILAVITVALATSAGPVKTENPNKPDLIAESELAKAEAAGTILTEAQIGALVDQNKVKEALKAMLAREAKLKEAKEKAKKVK